MLPFLLQMTVLVQLQVQLAEARKKNRFKQQSAILCEQIIRTIYTQNSTIKFSATFFNTPAVLPQRQ